MARIRTIKPDFFRHEGLFEAERESGLPLRVAYAGLFTVADREGRFRWRPRQLKLDVLPFDEVDFARVLDVLCTGGFIERYTSGGEEYGRIPSWLKHQVINNRESASTLPAPPDQVTPSSHVNDATGAREAHVNDATGAPLVQEAGEGKGREEEGNGKDAAIATPKAQRTHPTKAKSEMPPDFGVSSRVKAWAKTKGYGELGAHLEAFTAKCAAHRYAYADWDAAFMEAIREDWAKLRGESGRGSMPARPKAQHADDMIGATP
jgi:hypothetical protein